MASMRTEAVPARGSLARFSRLQANRGSWLNKAVVANRRHIRFIRMESSCRYLPPCLASDVFKPKGLVWRPSNLFMSTGESKPMRSLPPKRNKFAPHVRPLFSRARGSSGRWDTVCMKCYRILVADEKDGLPSLEAAHKCSGFNLATLLRPENIRRNAIWRSHGAPPR